MKKQLEKLDNQTLRKIASSQVVIYPGMTRTKLIADLVEYFKCYNIRWSDLVCRYSL